jgi:hypothetical protein
VRVGGGRVAAENSVCWGCLVYVWWSSGCPVLSSDAATKDATLAYCTSCLRRKNLQKSKIYDIIYVAKRAMC